VYDKGKRFTRICWRPWTVRIRRYNPEVSDEAAVLPCLMMYGNEPSRGSDQTLRVWRCRTTFDCTDACPRDIEVTKAFRK